RAAVRAPVSGDERVRAGLSLSRENGELLRERSHPSVVVDRERLNPAVLGRTGRAGDAEERRAALDACGWIVERDAERGEVNGLKPPKQRGSDGCERERRAPRRAPASKAVSAPRVLAEPSELVSDLLILNREVPALV